MKTMDDYKAFLAAVRKKTGIEALTNEEAEAAALGREPRR